jgi:hypothetical protein
MAAGWHSQIASMRSHHLNVKSRVSELKINDCSCLAGTQFCHIARANGSKARF